MMLAEAKQLAGHAWTTLDPYKRDLDNTSIVLMVVTIFGWLPQMTMLVTFIWSCIRLYETKTVQGWLGRRPPDKGGNLE